jgi:hypothetical protein
MESAAELHEARVLRARIEVKQAEFAALVAPFRETPPDLLRRLAAEIDLLKAEYRRHLAAQADMDYRRRRAEWRSQQETARRPNRSRDCACA